MCRSRVYVLQKIHISNRSWKIFVNYFEKWNRQSIYICFSFLEFFEQADNLIQRSSYVIYILHIIMMDLSFVKNVSYRTTIIQISKKESIYLWDFQYIFESDLRAGIKIMSSFLYWVFLFEENLRWQFLHNDLCEKNFCIFENNNIFDLTLSIVSFCCRWRVNRHGNIDIQKKKFQTFLWHSSSWQFIWIISCIAVVFD